MGSSMRSVEAKGATFAKGTPRTIRARLSRPRPAPAKSPNAAAPTGAAPTGQPEARRADGKVALGPWTEGFGAAPAPAAPAIPLEFGGGGGGGGGGAFPHARGGTRLAGMVVDAVPEAKEPPPAVKRARRAELVALSKTSGTRMKPQSWKAAPALSRGTIKQPTRGMN